LEDGDGIFMLNKKMTALIVGALLSILYMYLPIFNKTISEEPEKAPPQIISTDDASKEKEAIPQSKINPYSVAGFDNPAEFEAAFTKIQDLVARENKEAVAEYIQYPLAVYNNKGKIIIQNKEELINHYDEIFTAKVKNAFARQKLDNIFVNYKGVMVGQGEVWFTQSANSKYKYVILTINN
jgi:hypothetical protein